MTNGFPNGTARPSYFLHASGATRNNTWYVGDTGLTFTLSQPDGNAVTATGYTVRDFSGSIVTSGSFASGTTSLVIATPSGGWKPGWYRLYLTGATTGVAVYGDSYGVTNFQVLRVDSRFPTMPAKSAANGANAGAPVDAIMRGVCGIGPNRYSITTLSDPSAQITEIQNCLAIESSYYTNPTYADPARPRDLLVAFPNGGYDVVGIGGLRAFAKTAGAANLYIQVATGTSSGFKVTVATPDAATVVETYDNCADVPAIMTAAAASPRVVFTGVGNTGVGGPFAIPTTAYSGVIQVVTALYPAVKWYDGPSNEPGEDGSATIAQEMRVFAAAVHAGNANAKALGPGHVSEAFGATSMSSFLVNGGGNYCDGISYHAYNMGMGDPNIAKKAYAGFAAVLAQYSAQTAGKPLWQTEQGVYTPVFGTYHPRKARWQTLQLLTQDQFGVPREQNHMWYDQSHGFWSQPTWLLNSDASPNPQVTLTRVMAEEVWGKAYEAAVDFGDPGKYMFVGNSYLAANGTRVLALQAFSPLDTPTVTFALAGTVPASVTVSDGFGNLSTVTVGKFNRVTVSIADIPTYLRLPAGCTATVYQRGTWPVIATRTSFIGPAGVAAWVSRIDSLATNRASFQPLASINDGNYQTAGYNYNNAYQSNQTINSGPDWVRVRWQQPTAIDRVVIWSGFAYQAQCALLTFQIQTSNDGSTWTTQATVDKSAGATSFAWGTDDATTGTTADTFWPEQWIFDVALPRVQALYLRVYVTATSMGGAPDATAIQAGNLADDGNMRLTISQLGIYNDDSVQPRYVTV